MTNNSDRQDGGGRQFHACDTCRTHHSCNKTGQCLFTRATPPPTRDAVREALADLQSHHSSWRHILEGVREHSARCREKDDASYIEHEIKALDRVVASLAAPVPSPDGPDVILDSEEKYLLEHFDAECGLMPGDIQGSFHRLREVLLSPSPAVAAEPVAWECTDERYKYILGTVTTRAETVEAWREGGIKFAPLVRSVRGDREAALRLLQASSCFRGEVCGSLPCACAESLADLSLPVQYGAGERDSDAAEADRYFNLAGEFGNQLQTLAGVAQDAVDILAERKRGNDARSPSHNARVILETALKSVSPSALPSRQAPHSSSEGGHG